MTETLENLKLLARKLEQTRSEIQTEEATKTALIMPFIANVLGFDVFNAFEVIPEFTADVGSRKAEKVDFAIVNEDKVTILIECKRVGDELSLNNASQLFRYFSVTEARIAILTNGNHYKFYTDLDAPNKMDSTPFLELRLDRLDPTLAKEVEKLTKKKFDLDSVLSAAEELKYLSAVKQVLNEELKELSYEFNTLLLNKVYAGRATAKVRESLTPILQRGFRDFINDQVNNRLQSALGESAPPAVEVAEPVESDNETALSKDIETTEDEIRGHMIIQAIVSNVIDPDRVVMRDAKSYCAILIDDNNRKPLCRLHFNNHKNLRIQIFNADKESEPITPISSLTDLHIFAELLQATAKALA